MTIWVCVDCMLHHANGECGSCHDDVNGHDKEPLSLLARQDYAMGGEHSEYCEGEDCDCETNTFSTSRCEGCGSWLHGERHAFTVFEPKTYKVIRFFRDSGRKFTIKTGLTQALAQAHCNDPETSSSTCTNAAGKRRTRRSGPWFDGWTEEH
jgi:hypothetical protein